MIAFDTPDPPAYFWIWSDGSHSTVRTLRGPRAVPTLIITGLPAHPGDAVALDFKRGGHWYRETSARTNAAGIAVLHLYPYCEADQWCAETVHYRIVVAGQVQLITVQYLRTSP